MINKMITCWKLQLTDGRKIFLTCCDENIIFENEEYLSNACFIPSSIINSNELGQDSFYLSGTADNKIIKKEELLRGDFSNAHLEVFLLDLADENKNKILLKSGYLGEIKYTDNHFMIEINSLSMKTNNLIGKYYSSYCRADFGDNFCSKKKEDYTFFGKVSSVLSNNSFIDNLRHEPEGYFSEGILEFITGNNINKKISVVSFMNQTIQINENIKITKADKYKITAGCNKSLDCCINKFNNALNFRGEPYIPGRYKSLACY